MLCNRSHSTVRKAILYLAHTVPLGEASEPPIYYDRVSAKRNPSHRPYRVFLRNDPI